MASEWSDKSQPPPVEDSVPAEVVEMVKEHWAKAQKTPRIWQKLGWTLWTLMILIGGATDWIIWGEPPPSPVSMEGGDYCAFGLR
jgi:hypothetical protein